MARERRQRRWAVAPRSAWWRLGMPPRCTSPTLYLRLFPRPPSCSPRRLHAARQPSPEPQASGHSVTPPPSSLLESQNCRTWHFDSGSREQRGFRFLQHGLTCRPGNRCNGAFFFFFLSGSRYPCVCQSTNRMHTHFRPCIYTETGSITFLGFFFFGLFLNQRE